MSDEQKGQSSQSIDVDQIISQNAVVGSNNTVTIIINGERKVVEPVVRVRRWLAEEQRFTDDLHLRRDEVALIFTIGRGKEMIAQVLKQMPQLDSVADVLLISNSADPDKLVELEEKSKEPWLAVVETFRQLVHSIRADKTLRLFYAGPVILAMALGRQIGYNNFANDKIHFYHRSNKDSNYYEVI